MTLRKTKLIILIIVCVFICGVGVFLYLQKTQFDDVKQIEFMKKELKARLTYWVDHQNPTSLHRHIINRANTALGYLSNRKTLKQPYILYCHLGFKWQRARDGPLGGLFFKWFEIGYESAGIQISFSQDGNTKTVTVPFPPYMWDEAARARYKEVAERVFSLPAELVNDGIKFEVRGKDDSGHVHLYSTFKLPLSIISEPAYVTIYDLKGNKSEPLELVVSEEVTEFILQKYDKKQK
jgi:hypothetical protein